MTFLNQNPIGPPTPTFPKNHVVGVVQDLQEAEQALQALQNVGYVEMRLIQSQEVVEGIQGRLQDQNLLRNILHQLGTTSDEGSGAMCYLEQARHGWHMFAIYASNGEQAEQIAQLLSKYHVSLLKYYGPWSITNFRL